MICLLDATWKTAVPSGEVSIMSYIKSTLAVCVTFGEMQAPQNGNLKETPLYVNYAHECVGYYMTSKNSGSVRVYIFSERLHQILADIGPYSPVLRSLKSSTGSNRCTIYYGL